VLELMFIVGICVTLDMVQSRNFCLSCHDSMSEFVLELTWFSAGLCVEVDLVHCLTLC
jgi:nitrate/TMAO reductase-like tetraheme cytochrome c subunit